MTEPSRAVFLSYASQDAEAATKICASLRTAGIEVWFDQSELRGGDVWDRQIRKQIHDCALFVPIISASTQARPEGYFRLEWKLGVERTHLMSDRVAFLVPVVVDGTSDAEADVPDAFRTVQWTRIPGGETPPTFCQRVAALIAGTEKPGPTPVSGRLVPPAASPRTFSRWIAIVVAVFIVVAAVALKPWQLVKPKPAAVPVAAPVVESTTTAIPEKSIAVLPFVDMTEKHDQEYFSDGLSEELIDLLTQVQDLRVPARTSSFSFKGKSDDVTTIAQKLRVAHVLEGSVRKAGNTIRITAQLIRADNGYHLWSETYDRDIKDIFKVQDEIAGAVVAALKIKLVGTIPDKRLVNESAVAYDLLLEGRFFQERGGVGDGARAIKLYERALQVDASYALAWADLGWVLQWQWTHRDLERARQAAFKAVELGPDLAHTHAMLGWFESQIAHDWPAAAAEFDRALAIEPLNVRALWGKAALERTVGRLDGSLRYYRAALERDPIAAWVAQGLSTTLLAAGRLDEAEWQARRALEISPSIEWGHWYVGAVLLEKNDLESALHEMQLEPLVFARRYGIALAEYALGHKSNSDAALRKMLRQDSSENPYGIATVYAARGDASSAVVWLERARVNCDLGLDLVTTDRLFKKIRGDPGFKAFLRKMNLPE